MSVMRPHKQRVTLLITALVMALQVMAGGMNVLIFGDSNCWIGGDDCSKEQGWTKWFVDDFKPASCRSYARSGATWTHTDNTTENIKENIEVLGDNNVIYNQIRRAQIDVSEGDLPMPDLVIVAAGANDVWFVKKRPDALNTGDLLSLSTSSDEFTGLIPINRLTSLTKVVGYDVSLLKKSFPGAVIVLVTPSQSTRYKNDDVLLAGNLIERAVAQMQGVFVLRLDKEGVIKREQELKAKKFTTDGVHTTVAGAQSNGKLISSKVKKLLNITLTNPF